MPPKELNRHQLSNRLQFQSHTPSFLRAFKAKVSGHRVNDDEDGPQYENADEYEQELNGDGQEPMVDEFGREIRRESTSTGGHERDEVGRGHGNIRDAYGRDHDARDVGGDDEDDEDEKPQVVVLKEGKHLTEREAENERRKARGPSPLSEPEEGANPSHPNSNTKSSEAGGNAIKTSGKSTKASSKSAVQIGGKVNTAAKRKAPIATQDGEEASGPKPKKLKTEGKDSGKKKKASKNLLSFGDDG